MSLRADIAESCTIGLRLRDFSIHSELQEKEADDRNSAMCELVLVHEPCNCHDMHVLPHTPLESDCTT